MYLFFFCQRGDGDICLTKPKDKESRQWIQFHLWWKLRFHLEKCFIVLRFFSLYYQMYMLHCGMYWMYSKYEWNQSDISLKLFNAYIYTDVTCICTQCYYFCISVKMLLCHSTCFKCSREITPASLMQLQHFIFTCLLHCKTAFFFLFPVYEINGNILYF